MSRLLQPKQDRVERFEPSFNEHEFMNSVFRREREAQQAAEAEHAVAKRFIDGQRRRHIRPWWLAFWPW